MPQREIDTKARGVHSHMRRLHSDPLLIRSQPLTFVRSEAAWTLPVCSSANLRLLGQGRGGQKTMCCWLQRWWSPSDGCSQRGPCSSSSTSHFAMLQEGDWEGHRGSVRCACEEMMICSGCVGPCVPLWAKCPLYRLFHQPKGICLASRQS